MKLKTLIPLLGLITLSLHTQSYAQTNTNRQFSKNHGIAVNKALQAINAEDHHTALAILNKTLEEHPDLNPYEKSIIYQMQGSSYYEFNQLGSAISAFENAINAGGLLPNEESALEVNIAQLLISNGQLSEGEQRLENYINDGGEPKLKSFERLNPHDIQPKNYASALPWAEKWFETANPKERKHYDLMNFLYNNLELRDKQIEIIKEMIGRWPEDKALRDTLASIHAKQERE